MQLVQAGPRHYVHERAAAILGRRPTLHHLEFLNVVDRGQQSLRAIPCVARLYTVIQVACVVLAQAWDGHTHGGGTRPLRGRRTHTGNDRHTRTIKAATEQDVGPRHSICYFRLWCLRCPLAGSAAAGAEGDAGIPNSSAVGIWCVCCQSSSTWSILSSRCCQSWMRRS